MTKYNFYFVWQFLDKNKKWKLLNIQNDIYIHHGYYSTKPPYRAYFYAAGFFSDGQLL